MLVGLAAILFILYGALQLLGVVMVVGAISALLFAIFLYLILPLIILGMIWCFLVWCKEQWDLRRRTKR